MGWLSPTVLILAAVFVVSIIVFFRIEVGTSNAFVDFALFDRGLQKTNDREAILFTGSHCGLHVFGDALFERHRREEAQLGRGRAEYSRGLLRLR